MSLFKRLEFCRIRIVSCLGDLYEFDERVGDAAHRRNDHRGMFADPLLCSQDVGYGFVAVGIGDASAAKFMNDPFHVRHYNCAIISAGFQYARTV